MGHRTLSIILALGLAPALVAAPILGPAVARAQIQPDEIRAEAALDRIAARYRGRALGIERRPARPHERGVAAAWEARWLTPLGNVLRIRLDAASGAFLEVEGVGQSAARIAP